MTLLLTSTPTPFQHTWNTWNTWDSAFNDSITTTTTTSSQNHTTSEYNVRNPASIILVILLGGLISVTIVGNVLVCLAVVLVRKLRRPQNYLLVSLATSDLMVALSVMPFAILNEVHQNQWPLNSAVCDLWVSADVLCCTASILNLCGISIDRYQAITSPLDYSAKTSPRRMLSIILSVWLGSACVSLPPLLLLGNEHFDPDNSNIQICTVSQNFWYQIYATMASFYVPLLVMVVLYYKILRLVAVQKRSMDWKPLPLLHQPSNQSLLKSLKMRTLVSLDGTGKPRTQLRKSSCPQQHLNSTSPRFRRQKMTLSLREHKASATLGIIMSAFIVCWLPFFVLALLRPFSTIYHFEIPGWVSSLFLWLGYTNSALNPVIYATLNRDFRRPFQEMLCLRCSTLDSLMRREFYKHQFGEDSSTGKGTKKSKPPPLIEETAFQVLTGNEESTIKET